MRQRAAGVNEGIQRNAEQKDEGRKPCWRKKERKERKLRPATLLLLTLLFISLIYFPSLSFYFTAFDLISFPLTCFLPFIYYISASFLFPLSSVIIWFPLFSFPTFLEPCLLLPSFLPSDFFNVISSSFLVSFPFSVSSHPLSSFVLFHLLLPSLVSFSLIYSNPHCSMS